jgi:molybdopterin-guanine dinucleotide biosynthesis protein A
MATAGHMAQLPPCTAVLLAGSAGSRLYPLNASDTPKVLLPVANRPLLTFPLRMLEESGVSDVLMVRWRSPPRACLAVPCSAVLLLGRSAARLQLGPPLPRLRPMSFC